MANPDQKTILIDNAFEEIKNICINLQKDTDASNSELKSLLKLIINDTGSVLVGTRTCTVIAIMNYEV